MEGQENRENASAGEQGDCPFIRTGSRPEQKDRKTDIAKENGAMAGEKKDCLGRKIGRLPQQENRKTAPAEEKEGCQRSKDRKEQLPSMKS